MVPASFVAGRSANPPKIWRTHKTRKMADKYAATLLTKGTKRKDTLSDHSQNSPNLIHTMKIYDIDVQIATKNPPFAIAAGGYYSPDKYRMPLGKNLYSLPSFGIFITYLKKHASCRNSLKNNAPVVRKLPTSVLCE